MYNRPYIEQFDKRNNDIDWNYDYDNDNYIHTNLIISEHVMISTIYNHKLIKTPQLFTTHTKTTKI